MIKKHRAIIHTNFKTVVNSNEGWRRKEIGVSYINNALQIHFLKKSSESNVAKCRLGYWSTNVSHYFLLFLFDLFYNQSC